MVSVEEAQKLVLDNTRLLDEIELSIEEALGLVLSADVISPVNLPLFTNSAMDGYAVSSEDTVSASPENPVHLKVVRTVRAGDFPDFSITSGNAAKIMTGAPVPDGADTVVRIEDADEEEGNLILTGASEKGSNVRFEGEEIRSGEIALNAGVEITAAAAGFLTELGVKRVGVLRTPRVSVIVTGEELAGPEEEIKPGKIRDTNSVTLKAAISGEKAELVSSGRVADTRPDIEEGIGKALGSCDALIITGGVSVGDYDFVRDILGGLGVEKIFWGVSQRPGGPMFFGRCKDTLVFGLPGNPASSLVCYYEYVRPALRKMTGKNDIFLHEADALLQNPVSKKPGKTHFLRGFVSRGIEGSYVKASEEQGSHMLKSFAQANCLIVFREGDSYLPENSRVKVHLFP
ncbi:MAG: molybdopterin molybdotransferase MoeA [Candidatus Dadabacteria bacterium]|nr:molybdopterin molybdotransferase MoeA [Candidatus Dadabacteria bacterium]